LEKGSLKNYSWIAILLILLGSAICVPISVVSVEPVPPVVPASGTFEKYGPRVYDLIFSVWGDVLSEAQALKAGHIDAMDWPVPIGDVADWLADPNITMGEFEGLSIYFYALNNRMWPMGHGVMVPPGWSGSEPAVVTGHYWFDESCQRCLDARQFRRALAHITDRDAMVLFMEGFAEATETFIPPVLQEWENPAAPKYDYSLDLAEQALIDGGFQDWDDDNFLEYSPSHGAVPGDYEELPVLQGVIRSDDPGLSFAGELLRNDLMKLEVRLAFPIVDRGTWYYRVYVVRDFHVYVDVLGGHRSDPSSYYEIFYSESESPIGYHSEEFDYWFEKFKYAITMEEALEACYMCQYIVARDVASIPLYVYVSYFAHRTNYGDHVGEEMFAGLKWEGFVNELGVGFPNFWTYLNAHPEVGKGGTLRQGVLVNIEKFSPVHAEWFHDWLVLDEIYEPLIKNHPYNLTEKIPWLCRNWTIGTWEFAGKNCTKIRFELCPGILWHDNTPVTVEDVAFTFAYMRDEVSIANYWAVTNYYGAITAANGSGWWGPQLPPDAIEILYDVESWFALDWVAGVPIIPKHIWEGKDSHIWDPEDHDAVIGTGPFMCMKDGVVGRPDFTFEYVHLDANPAYYCRYVWPDVCAAGGAIGRDEVVTMFDYGVVAEPDAYLTYDPRLYPLLPPWPAEWIVDGDQLLDVDKDGAIDTDDLLDISLYFGWAWPPPWYVDC
jgi:ABC-type transport system substrate-binding protein